MNPPNSFECSTDVFIASTTTNMNVHGGVVTQHARSCKALHTPVVCFVTNVKSTKCMAGPRRSCSAAILVANAIQIEASPARRTATSTNGESTVELSGSPKERKVPVRERGLIPPRQSLT